MILIALGANLDGPHGSPIQTLQKCDRFLADEHIFVQNASHIWKSAPVPISDQPWYHNAVCNVETDKTPHDVLNALRKIEHENGRTRHTQNEARSLDLDIIAYNDIIIETETLHIPHPRMHERAFVLRPLLEIAPDWVHPVIGKTTDMLISEMPTGQDIERIEGVVIK